MKLNKIVGSCYDRKAADHVTTINKPCQLITIMFLKS